MIDELSFDQRKVAGRVVAVFTNYVDVELDKPLSGTRIARVNRNHWPVAAKNWSVADRIEGLFIYNLSSDAKEGPGRGHWFGSILWAKNEENPWNKFHDAHPVEGDVVEGEVLRIIGESLAILRLDKSGLEAFLHIREVPDGKFKSIAELLPLGLKLRAKIINVESLRCKFDVSILAWLADMERIQGKEPQTIGVGIEQTPYLRFAEAPNLQVPNTSKKQDDSQIWQGRGVLVLDDDRVFRTNIVAWLRQFGALAWATDSPTFAEEVLKKHGDKISHVLLDYSLGSRKLQAELLHLLKRLKKEKKIAVISGLPEVDAPRFAQIIGFDFFPKPLRFSAVHAWLKEGKATVFNSEKYTPAPYWQNATLSVANGVSDRGAAWLKVVCRQTHSIAACWLRCYRPGYAMVAAFGLTFANDQKLVTQFLSHLNQTIVSDVEQSGKPDFIERKDLGPIKFVVPEKALYVCALPLFENKELDKVDDVLLIFFAYRDNAIHIQSENFEELQTWWRDLLSLEQIQDRLNEEAVFATQGRVHAATLHELRPMMQVFESQKPWKEDVALGWWEQGRKVKRLVDSGLYNIRPERAAQVNLRERLHTLMDTFVWQIVSKREINVLVYLPPADLIICLPPEVFEQPLINLVDNATKFCARRRWARVEVRVFVDQTDSVHPLVIQVRDQGVGMTPEEERYLFRPRHSASGGNGFGMGLYVSSSLAKAVGGELLLVENRRWAGSTFQLRLPLVWGQLEKGVQP